MNVLIVDDNQMSRMLVERLVQLHTNYHVLASCENASVALEWLKKEPVDLIFLDVEMPGMSGPELLSVLENRPLTIIISAKADYAVQAFDLNVVDFMVTPISEARFLKAIKKVENLASLAPAKIERTDHNHVFIKEKGDLIKLNFDEILFLQALGDYVTIHTTSGKYTIRLNLKKAEEKLPANKFMRVHRSYIIALDKISRIEDHTAIIGKELIPISENSRQALIDQLNIL